MKYFIKILPFTFLFLFVNHSTFSIENRSNSNKKKCDSINQVKLKITQTNKINYEEAQNLFKNKKYSESLKIALNLIEDSKRTKDNDLYTDTHFLVGDIFTKINNHDKAIQYYKAAHDFLNRTENLDGLNTSSFKNDLLIRSYLSIGSSFLRVKKIDSSRYYYNKAINIPSSSKKGLSYKARVYSNLSGIFFRLKNYEDAKTSANKAIEIHKSQNEKTYLSAALTNLASIYLLEKDYGKAQKKYFESLSLIKNDTTADAIKFKERLYYNLAWTLYLQKDYTAYEYQEKSYLIKDNLRDKEIRRIVEEIDAQSKLDIEKEKTEFAKRQKELLEAEQNKTNLYLGLLSLLVIIASGVVIYNYKLRQKNLHLKLSESNLLQQQSIEKLKSEAQIKILNATIDGKESERKLIAETLHDNVSALLSSANMHLSATKKQHNGDTPIEVEKTRAIILEASQKVRDLSHNLVSSILLKFGLEYAIKDVAKKYSNSQLNFEVSAKNVNRYNQDFEIKIFNIIQELINNIIKHSKANHAKIALKEEKNQLTILIRDDGVGFTPSSSSIKDGIGLNQIDARIHVLNGKFIISSELNKGTEAIITVPIQQQKKEFKLTSVS